MEEKTTFGRFISQKRREAGFTQKELAEMLYVTESAVSKWERGVSYPDIALVNAICGALQITEHELITASDDLYQRKLEKQARSFRTIVKTYIWAFYLIYGIALLACFICNLAIDHTLSWFFIVLTSIMVAFSLTCVPVLAEKRRGLITLGTFFISLIILLFTCNIYTGGDWFWTASVSVLFGFAVIFAPVIFRSIVLPTRLNKHKTLICFTLDSILLFVLLAVAVPYSGHADALLPEAFPIALFFLSWAWIIMLVIRYFPINRLFKGSVCLFASAIYIFFANSLSNYIVYQMPFTVLQWNLSNWNEEYINGNVTILTVLLLVFVALMLLIGGIVLHIRHCSKN